MDTDALLSLMILGMTESVMTSPSSRCLILPDAMKSSIVSTREWRNAIHSPWNALIDALSVMRSEMVHDSRISKEPSFVLT